MSHVVEKKIKKSNKNDAGCKNSNQERTRTTPRKLTCSPILPNSLPDDCDNIDVVWDWYSPTSKPRLTKQRAKVQQSPKLLVKRHPSNDKISVFNKLEEELKTVANTTITKLNIIPEKNLETCNKLPKTDHLDIFNDSLDEEFVIISQQVENSVLQKECDSAKLPINEQDCRFNHDKFTSTDIGNDSLDCMFAAIKDEDLNIENKNEHTLPKIVTSPKVESPIKCSPEEIEQKRLQALERRKAKKLQDDIERKRQEALKRLELSKKRRILQN